MEQVLLTRKPKPTGALADDSELGDALNLRLCLPRSISSA